MLLATRKANTKSERGVALFIAIFALLLISVVTLGLMLMAGTESALNSNYKSSVQAFYDAKAGAEEARGRMWSGNPNAFASFVVASGSTLAVGQARYLLNPANGETVNPTDMSSNNPYADTQYSKEWGGQIRRHLALRSPLSRPRPASQVPSISGCASLHGPSSLRASMSMAIACSTTQTRYITTALSSSYQVRSLMAIPLIRSSRSPRSQ